MSNSLYHKNDIFSLKLAISDSSTYIMMRMYEDILRTKYLPKTSDYLEKFLPSIFAAKCFNVNRFTFRQEVKNTQVGHLFEHILLEYLSREKRRLGHKTAIYNGLTSWNWEEDRKGTFHINIDCGADDIEILPSALYLSIELFHDVVRSAKSKQMII